MSNPTGQPYGQDGSTQPPQPPLPPSQQPPIVQPGYQQPSYQAGVPSPQYQPQYQAPGYQPPGQPGPQTPQTPARPRRLGLLIGLIGGGVALIVLVLVGVAVFTSMSASHAPEASVRAYLSAVTSGDIEKALKLDGTKVTSADVLLTNAAYRTASDRVDSFRVATGQVSGDNAVVRAQLGRSSGSVTETFELKRTGTDVFFPVWKLEPVSLGKVVVDVGAPPSAQVQVGGITAKRGDAGAVSLRAFPGSYSATLAESDLFTADKSTATVVGFADQTSKPAVLDAALTDSGEKAANDAIDEYLTACMASTDPAPAGCPNWVDNKSDYSNYSNVSWTLVSAPIFVVEGSKWADGGWVVDTSEPGAADFSANAVDSSGQPASLSLDSPESIIITGSIADVTAKGATYVPAPDYTYGATPTT